MRRLLLLVVRLHSSLTFRVCVSVGNGPHHDVVGSSSLPLGCGEHFSRNHYPERHAAMKTAQALKRHHASSDASYQNPPASCIHHGPAIRACQVSSSPKLSRGHEKSRREHSTYLFGTNEATAQAWYRCGKARWGCRCFGTFWRRRDDLGRQIWDLDPFGFVVVGSWDDLQ